VAWHATVVHVSLGVVALAAVLAIGRPLGAWMRAPALPSYLPGLALAGMLERVAYMPERVLARRMRFRAIGLARTAGEVAYTVGSVALAAAGWGAMAVVAANVVRSVVRLAGLAASVPRGEWLRPARWSPQTVRAMLRFGLPTSVGTAAGMAARRVDNAIVSSMFGAGVVGAYNLAYNVADVPAVQVGEQIGDVLLPSFSRMDPAARRAALVRSTGLLALVTFPLAVGLGAIATPLVEALLRPEWRDVGPMVAVLSALSVVRPVSWVISSYQLACGRPRLDAALEIGKLAAIVVLLPTLGRGGPLRACLAVGVAFGLHSVASMVAVRRLDGVRVRDLAAKCARPLLACAPMAAVVMLVRALVHPAGAAVVCAVAAGAAAYALAALLLAPESAADLIRLALTPTLVRLRGGRLPPGRERRLRACRRRTRTRSRRV
jgi:PST family polysaccharide transporter